jgi:D-glycero-D-manno-heptose 1,7-bisphosphate phosphatase
VVEGLQRLADAGFQLFIVSNQSGVGRGLITREQVAAVNAEMMRQMGKNFFAGIYNCYAAPEDPYSDERKPSPAMVLRARDEHNLDLSRSYFIGDKLLDIQCGKNAGCHSILVLSGPDGPEKEQAKKEADHVAANFAAACQWLAEHAEGRP